MLEYLIDNTFIRVIGTAQFTQSLDVSAQVLISLRRRLL